uniref:Integrase, catalytic region, zinc finger, CCHC-type, peptidase aspartic, catalytic n=1 Tax=Tanacetum cinerariifolium TaxID=118510 RepID=A0A699GR09_TANCI|nr:integrase, catalytic region, zinc finger, CCHC-type, peptidase aspartic, catalytic [Tanacetum cinerariifolium]
MESPYFSLLMKAHSRWDSAEIRLLQGLPRDIYKLINHNTDAKDIWNNVKMLLEGSELTKDDHESQLYDEFEHFEKHKGENIHDYYVRFTKIINDLRHIKMTMPKIQLNSKFVNMLPEWGRFMTAVKLNSGLKESNHDQLYAYLKQHELHANENKMLMERLNQHSHDPLFLVSNVSPYQYPSSSPVPSQPSYISPVTYQPLFTDNIQLDTGTDIAKIIKKWPKLDKNKHEIVKSSQKPDPKTFLMEQSHWPGDLSKDQGSTYQVINYTTSFVKEAQRGYTRIATLAIRRRHNKLQGNNAMGAIVAGNKGAQNRVGNANAGQGNLIKCYNFNGIGHIARNYNQLKRPKNFDYFKEKMLLMQAQESGVDLDEEQLLFLAGRQTNTFDDDVDKGPVQDMAQNEDNIFQADQCDAFDSDVDEAPTAQTKFMANLSSAEPIYDEVGPLYDSYTLFEVQDHDNSLDNMNESYKEHEMQNDVQPNDVVDSDTEYTSNSSIILYEQVAICYKNPFYLSKAKQVQPALYNGHKIVTTNHARALVHDSEDTLEIAETTRKQMIEKMKDPECVKNKFVDQSVDQMNDLMNPRRREDRNGRRSEDKESENPFFEGDDSSSDENWIDQGICLLNQLSRIYEMRKRSILLLTIIKNFKRKKIMSLRKKKDFSGKKDLMGEKGNIKDVVVMANDLCSSMIQTTLNAHFEEEINTKSYELMSFGKSILIKLVSFANQMNDMMNPRRHRDRDGRRGEGKELEYLFFKGDGSSFDEWGDYGVSDDDYEEATVSDDDQYEDVIEEEEGFVDSYLNFQDDENNVSFLGVVLGVEEESMPVYDTDIEDVIDGEENNMEGVVVVANDLCSSKIQTTLSVNFSKTVNSNPQELILLKKGNLVEVSILICKKYQEEYLKVASMDDKFGFKTIKVRGRVIIKKGNLMQRIQIWMLRVQGTSEANSKSNFFQVVENDAIAPHDYSKENYLATITPQKQLTPEQIFWSNDLLKMKAKALKEKSKSAKPITAMMVYPLNTPAKLVPKVLPIKSHVQLNTYSLVQLFLEYDKTCKKKITPTGLTKGERVFEQTKTCYVTEVIPFFKKIKEHFDEIQKALINENKEMKEVFNQIEAEVDQNVVDKKCNEIERKNILSENENLIAECLSKDVFYTATDYVLTVSRFFDMHDAYTVTQKCIAKLEAENSNPTHKIKKDNHDEMIKHFSKLEVEHLNLQLKYQHLKEHFGNKKSVTSLDAPAFESVFVIGNLKEQLQGMGNTIGELKDKISRLQKKHRKMKCVTMPNPVKLKVLAPGMYAIDVEPIPPRNRNNRKVHLDYLKHLKESVKTLCEIVEEARDEKPSDSLLASATFTLITLRNCLNM